MSKKPKISDLFDNTFADGETFEPDYATLERDLIQKAGKTHGLTASYERAPKDESPHPIRMLVEMRMDKFRRASLVIMPYEIYKMWLAENRREGLPDTIRGARVQFRHTATHITLGALYGGEPLLF